MCSTAEVINPSHQNVRKRVVLAGHSLSVVGWDDIQVIYSTGEECVDLTGSFTQTEFGVTAQQYMEQHWARFHLFTAILEASVKAMDFVHSRVGYFTVLYFSNSSELPFKLQTHLIFKYLSL